MSSSQLLDRTFQLYRRFFALFTGITLPAAAIQLGYRVVEPRLLAVAPGRGGSLIDFAASLVTFCITYALASGATISAISAVHLGRPATIRGCYASVWLTLGRVLKVSGAVYAIAFLPAAVFYGLLIALYGVLPSLIVEDGGTAQKLLILNAAALLIAGIWSIYAFIRCSLAVAAALVERVSVRLSLRRSRVLTKGSAWRISLVYSLTALFGFALTSALLLPSRFAPAISEIAWFAVAEFIGTTLAGPIATIAMALMYYDERVRKEAFDLELMMKALDPALASAGASEEGASSSLVCKNQRSHS